MQYTAFKFKVDKKSLHNSIIQLMLHAFNPSCIHLTLATPHPHPVPDSEVSKQLTGLVPKCAWLIDITLKKSHNTFSELNIQFCSIYQNSHSVANVISFFFFIVFNDFFAALDLFPLMDDRQLVTKAYSTTNYFFSSQFSFFSFLSVFFPQ